MLVYIRPIGIEEFPEYSKLAFEGDTGMETKYGTIQPGETPTERNVKNVMEYISIPGNGLSIYGIFVENEPAGFCAMTEVMGLSTLYSFGINMKFRTEEVKQQWLNILRETFGNFYVGLFTKNARAIKFFKKHGFKNEFQIPEESAVMLWE